LSNFLIKSRLLKANIPAMNPLLNGNQSAMIFKTFLCMLCIITSTMTHACRGPDSEDYVLLDALPLSASTQPVLAKVRVVSRQGDEATVVVMESIKGDQLGAGTGNEFVVTTSGSSCSWLDARTRFFNGQSAAHVRLSNIIFLQENLLNRMLKTIRASKANGLKVPGGGTPGFSNPFLANEGKVNEQANSGVSH
jgi:hypothetical protein